MFKLLRDVFRSCTRCCCILQPLRDAFCFRVAVESFNLCVLRFGPVRVAVECCSLHVVRFGFVLLKNVATFA